MQIKQLLFIFLLFVLIGCKKNEIVQPSPGATMYFPTNGSNAWETTSSSILSWNQNEIQALKDYLIQKNTKSFMILVNGRIVMEEYFNGH
jgi:hypothetical protein